MMHPILPLDSIGFQPIDESKQQILDDQDTITNGNILPVVPQGEVLVIIILSICNIKFVFVIIIGENWFVSEKQS
jgi:hypothetical protein